MNTPYTTTRSDWSFAATLLAIAAGLCLLPFSSRADVPAGLPMLLAAPAADSVRAAEKARPAERGVARQRPVAVAFEHLDPPSGNVPARIGVELFDGMIVVVDFVRIDRRGPGNYTWHGRVDGYDKSEAVLTVVDGNIAGTISLVDSAARITATYQLQTNRDGSQSLRQIDPSGFPTDHPPGSEKLRAPVLEKSAPRGSRGDIELKGGAIAAADTGATIDVMIVYSKQTAAAAGTAIGAQVQQAIDSANAAYANSGITTRLNLVHTAAVNYDESGDFNTDLNRLTSGSDGYMDEVATLRNTHAADLVSLFIENGQYCGIAWVGPSASYGFSVINRGCASGNLSFAHELGHNFGALHDPYVDPGTSPYAYGHGYAVPAAAWRTVMAYNNACSAAGTSCARIPYFSNPNLTYGTLPLGTASTSDNARVHNQNAATVANFRTSGTSSCTYAFSPASASVAATATSGSTSVTAGAGCAWTTTSNASWLAVGSNSATSGTGTLNYTAAANSGPARSGTIAVGGVNFTLSQANGCTYTLSASSASFAASGGSGSVNLTTGAGCAWTVSSSATWLTVSSAKTGSGSATVSFAAAANTSTSTLTANLSIGGATFVVTEAASIPLPPPTYQVSGTVKVGANALAGVSFTAAAGATCTSTDAAGRYACSIPHGWTGMVTPTMAGHTFTPGSRSYSSVTANLTAQDYVAATAVVWVGDAVPLGATAAGDTDGWTWVSSNPAPYSGSLAHQSAVVGGIHQHYFYNATTTLAVGVGDTLFADVYLDPANPPSEVMLQWNDGTWEHRAYWGANLISWGTNGTASRRYMGALPAVGQWVRLEVPAAQVGLEARTLNGMAFTLYGGRATWDSAGTAVAAPQSYQVGGTIALSGMGLGGVTLTATGGASCGATSGAGAYSCTVPLGWAGTVTPALAGHTFTPRSRSYSSVTANLTAQDYVAATAVVWVGDAVPLGATAAGDTDGWTWVSSNPAPYSGSLAHQSAVVGGIHQHYFYNATTTLAVGVGDTLFADVYLDPANPPSEVMLQWNDGTWEHRAYWGANLISWGTNGTASRRYMGALPAVGQWVRLEVPAAQVGLEARTLNGMAFTLYGGRATWDSAGKVSGASL